MKTNNFSTQQAIFQRSSTTYYYSSLFFPPAIQNKVTAFYAFVRTADDFVDKVPADVNNFQEFVKKTWSYFEKPYKPKSQTEKIIADFVDLAKKIDIKKEWIDAFFFSMNQDLPLRGKSHSYANRQELEKYIYGSAEVIGLIMCRILDLSTAAYPAARLQGAAMQLVNFIRDYDEDRQLGRNYLASFGQDNKFDQLIENALIVYKKIQKKAEAGYRFIPYRYRVPIMTAAHLYLWTANEIAKNPELIFVKKIKPTKARVFLTLLKSSILCLKY